MSMQSTRYQLAATAKIWSAWKEFLREELPPQLLLIKAVRVLRRLTILPTPAPSQSTQHGIWLPVIFHPLRPGGKLDTSPEMYNMEMPSFRRQVDVYGFSAGSFTDLESWVDFYMDKPELRLLLFLGPRPVRLFRR